MKRVASLFGALLGIALSFGAANAKLLVVTGLGPEPTLDQASYDAMHNRVNMAVLSTLDQFGVDYKIATPNAAKTEFIRTGNMVWNFGTPSAYTESFDAVLVLNMGARTASEKPFIRSVTGCYPCSTTVGGVTKAPLVPQGWLFGSSFGYSHAVNGTDLERWVNRAGAYACSTGVKSNAGSDYAATIVGSGSALPQLQYSPSTGLQWFSNANTMGFYPEAATAGGVRTLVKNFAPWHYSQPFLSTLLETNNADTVRFGAGADTAVIWERPFANLYAGASNTLPIKPIVFANVMGASPCYDSVGTYFLPCEYDPHITLLVLARLDSLTGGKVFSRPKKAAVVISGAFERTLRRLPGGANDQDSSVIKATIDSLAVLGVPLTVGANVDSIASYPNELAWWKLLPSARFSPYTTYGVTDTTKGANWSSDRLVDLFGRYRNRAIIGDSTFHAVAGADSSILYGLVTARSRLADYGLRLSGTVVAPLDDWSPKNILNNAAPLDSLATAFSRAGFSAALCDVQRPEGSVNRIAGSKLLVRGYDGQQKSHFNRLTGTSFKFIGHTGYSISGSSTQFLLMPSDSVTRPASISFGGSGPTSATITLQMLGRFWAGFLNDNFRDIDWFSNDGVSVMGGYLDVRYPSADLFNNFRRASVLKLHVSDLGGIPNGPPVRPGYWAIKSLANQFRVVNAWAGRSVLILAYPEDCEP